MDGLRWSAWVGARLLLPLVARAAAECHRTRMISEGSPRAAEAGCVRAGGGARARSDGRTYGELIEELEGDDEVGVAREQLEVEERGSRRLECSVEQ